MRNRLKELRARFNMTQEDLAVKAGVSRQTINAIETGKYDPSLPLAFKLASCFETSIEHLFMED